MVPLEVYLGLPIKLKEDYKIDINLGEMLYYSCSGLTEAHLRQAKDNLNDALNNKEKVLGFLIDQPKWIEALEQNNPEEVEVLKKERNDAVEDYERVANAQKEYLAGLKELSSQLIDQENLFQAKG